MKVLLERYPYRYCEEPERGYIQKYDYLTKRWRLFYECDSPRQLMTAMEDFDYTLWLDNQPCYRSRRGNVIQSPYKT